MDELRLFIALPYATNAEIRAKLAALREAARAPGSGLRVVPDVNLHVTLKFLGAVPASRVPAIAALMDRELSNCPSFEFQLEGAGSFHGALWLGVAANAALTGLAARANAAMAELGFAPEAKEYRPHLTLARLKPGAGFATREWLTRNRGSWDTARAGAVHLYRSDTLPGGARYTILHTTPLQSHA